MEPKLLLFPFRRSLFLMCYDVFTRCASYFEVFYYSYMNSFYGKMEVDFMAQWQPSTFTPDKTADTAAYAASLSASATSQSLNRTFLSSLYMPVRGLIYFSRLYEDYILDNGLDLYSSTQLLLPRAQFFVFYNGTSEQPVR